MGSILLWHFFCKGDHGGCLPTNLSGSQFIKQIEIMEKNAWSILGRSWTKHISIYEKGKVNVSTKPKMFFYSSLCTATSFYFYFPLPIETNGIYRTQRGRPESSSETVIKGIKRQSRSVCFYKELTTGSSSHFVDSLWERKSIYNLNLLRYLLLKGFFAKITGTCSLHFYTNIHLLGEVTFFKDCSWRMP